METKADESESIKYTKKITAYFQAQQEINRKMSSSLPKSFVYKAFNGDHDAFHFAS